MGCSTNFEGYNEGCCVESSTKSAEFVCGIKETVFTYLNKSLLWKIRQMCSLFWCRKIRFWKKIDSRQKTEHLTENNDDIF